MKSLWMTAAAAVLLAACGPQDEAPESEEPPMEENGAAAETPAGDAMESAEGDSANGMGDQAMSEEGDHLARVLAHERRADDRARDQYRHPREALEFFGIEPDMTVAEVLPGGGWYTRVLLPYVAEEGRYIALNYPAEVWSQMYASFGSEWDEDAAADHEAWPDTARASLAEFGPVEADDIDAYIIGQVPEAEYGQVDAVFYIRALHHLNRFERSHLDAAIAEAHDMLRPGGIAAVVQHRADAEHPPEMADGNRGYMHEDYVIDAFESGGFTLEASSEMNANPADAADYEAGVWVLPPTDAGEEDYSHIGESDRMTLLFRKPEE